MTNDNNIKKYSAFDIEKYHTGKLSAKEMHDMEKAALEDSFLADAIEGYALAGVNVNEDIKELKKRLAEKTEGAAVLPIDKNRNNNFRLLRVAAMLVFIAGAGLLIYQFGFNKKASDIAETKTETIGPANNSATPTSPSGTITDSTFVQPASPGETNLNKKEVAKSKDNTATGGQLKDLTITTAEPTMAMPKPANSDAVVENNTIPVVTAQKRTLAKETAISKEITVNNNAASGRAAQQTETDNNERAIVSSRKAEEQNDRSISNQISNVFQGRVTDPSNKGVPFANITNLSNKATTYTDADGYFKLTNADSVLNIQVSSIGFENTTTQIRNNVANSQVILQENKNNLSEVVVVGYQKPNAAARRRDANKNKVEPVPYAGWDNYDTYLANNLHVPEDFKGKQTANSSVELSFEINRNGVPVKIRIEKSLCSSCDKEAIRLVKEGPKWKRNSPNSRTKITVKF
jgi:hypothetical protein